MDTIHQEKSGFLRKKVKCLYPLIIKGFMSQPSKLDAVKCEKNFVTVLGRDGKTQMRLKAQYAYYYDEEIYQKLRNAYKSNDKETLEKLWQQAKPIAVS
jgi:ABC-type transport system substrate-binding protein